MSTEGTGHEDADGEERVDSALADDIESAFNGVVLNESGNPVASAEATGEAGPGAADDGARAVQDSGNAGDTADSGQAGESELDRARAEAARAADDLARARADLYNLQQEYQGFVRRSREAAVVEALIPVLDEIALARQHGDLTGTFETTADKLEAVLADKFGLERFGQEDEPFDPTIHEALMATESDEVSEPSIALVLQPGYRLGERVVRAARVQVVNPT